MPLLDEDYLILSTIHSAKGQEWRSVFVLNCIDGCIPSDLGTGTSEEIEEERRLLYVAMTRAKDELAPHHAAALLRPQPGAPRRPACLRERTRFIPETILDRFAPRLWPPVLAAAAAEARRPADHRIDLGATMRKMWG